MSSLEPSAAPQAPQSDRIPKLFVKLFAIAFWFPISAQFGHVAIGEFIYAQQMEQSDQRRPRERTSGNLISNLQLRAHRELGNAFTIVQALHSNWMIERGAGARVGNGGRLLPLGFRSRPGEFAGVQVYLDGHRLGPVDLLRNIPAQGIYSIRHMTGVEAQARYGMGHSEGVIYVATQPSFEKP